MKTGSARDDLALVEMAAQRGVELRVLGGRAFRHHVVGRAPAHLVRPPGDLDLFTLSRFRKGVQEVLEDIGMAPDREFNVINGKTRMIYWDGEEKVDVFIDEFRMCHQLDLRRRMELQPVTLPVADLLLTKLQIVELNEKDMKDLLAILLTSRITDHDAEQAINVEYLAAVLAKDWGLWRTCTHNLDKIAQASGELLRGAAEAVEAVEDRIRQIARAVEESAKSTSWRLRAVVGERVRWYELPEEP